MSKELKWKEFKCMMGFQSINPPGECIITTQRFLNIVGVEEELPDEPVSYNIKYSKYIAHSEIGVYGIYMVSRIYDKWALHLPTSLIDYYGSLDNCKLIAQEHYNKELK